MIHKVLINIMSSTPPPEVALCYTLWCHNRRIVSRTCQPKTYQNLCTKSTEICSLMVSQIPADFCPERATCKTFYNWLLVIFNGLSKFARNFTARSLKLISTHPIHIVHWRNFPIKRPRGSRWPQMRVDLCWFMIPLSSLMWLKEYLNMCHIFYNNFSVIFLQHA